MVKRIFKALGLLLLVLIGGAVLMAFINMKDHHPGYSADMKIINKGEAELKAGFSAVKITPVIHDSWTDANGDAKYDPADGDTYTDGNGNGKFDPVWIAGFGNSRAANGIHDDLWARTMVIDDGKTRLAIVALDAIGFMNDCVIDVRELISEEAAVTHTIIASLHDHEAPDLLGLWGKTPFRSGVNKDYLGFVKKQVVLSIEKAVSDLEPVVLELSEDPDGAAHLVKDTRDPQVFDSGLRIILARNKATGGVKGTLVSWADHPETLWSKNLLITSDFPHYVREGIEKGIFYGDSLIKNGTGGISVYLNGCLGGLMTTHPSLAVSHPVTGKEYSEPTFEKAEAQGLQVALLALEAMDNPAIRIETAGISLISRSVALPVHNTMFRLAMMLGVLDRGTSGWMKMRTEVSAFTIGPVSFVTIPGEIYPEIVNGGVEKPEGGDFANEPVEELSIRDMMPGQFKFVIGLANDEVGYIIPKSQWDVKAPYTYGRDSSPYGEENSVGPETAAIIYGKLKEILEELQ
jgi:hypothetical protein